MSLLESFLTSPERGPPRSSSPVNGNDDELPGFGPSTESLSLNVNPIQSRKRPAEDMTQYAESAARNVRLRPDNKEELLRFANVRWLSNHTYFAN